MQLIFGLCRNCSGSEYINHMVAKLLEELRLEQTQSRLPNMSNG